ncbi:MAG: hypothetical protein AABY13_03255 [Nanoarchaeota archaeon]
MRTIVVVLMILALVAACAPASQPTAQRPSGQSPPIIEPDAQKIPTLLPTDVKFTFTKCFTTRYSNRDASNVNLEASGTAQGPSGMIFSIRSDKVPTATITECGAWTFRNDTKTCLRGEGQPAETTWKGKDVALVPGDQHGRQLVLTPTVNIGDGVRIMNDLAFTVTCD